MQPLLVVTWNLFHGRTVPPSGEAHLEEMVGLIAAAAPGVACLQELPVWALERLERWSGMRPIPAVTLPALGGALASASDRARARQAPVGASRARPTRFSWPVARCSRDERCSTQPARIPPTGGTAHAATGRRPRCMGPEPACCPGDPDRCGRRSVAVANAHLTTRLPTLALPRPSSSGRSRSRPDSPDRASRSCSVETSISRRRARPCWPASRRSDSRRRSRGSTRSSPAACGSFGTRRPGQTRAAGAVRLCSPTMHPSKQR